MKARGLVLGGLGGLLAGAMVMATSVAASANFAFCESDPPVQVVTPGGHNLTVNNQVFLAPGSQQLLNSVTDDAIAQGDGHGGTLITVHVYVPGTARVVSSVNRYGVKASSSGTGVVTLYLDVPIT